MADDQGSQPDITVGQLIRPGDSELSPEPLAEVQGQTQDEITLSQWSSPDDIVSTLTGLSIDQDYAGDLGEWESKDAHLTLKGAEPSHLIDLGSTSEDEIPELPVTLEGQSHPTEIDLNLTSLDNPALEGTATSIDLSAEGEILHPLPESTAYRMENTPVSSVETDKPIDLSQELARGRALALDETETPAAPIEISPREEKIDFSTHPAPHKNQPMDAPRSQSDWLEDIRSFSEQSPIGQPQISAALPFSILILGKLSESDEARLLSLLQDHQMGFNLDEIRAQFSSQRMFIPRISEYAAVMIVQTLRDAAVEVRMGLADEMIEMLRAQRPERTGQTALSPQPRATALADTEEELSPEHPLLPTQNREQDFLYAEFFTEKAQKIPLLSSSTIPGNIKPWKVIDTITASATLKTSLVEAQRSHEYQDLLERLQAELKFKAYIKGATAVIRFNITLTPLLTSTHYRLMAMGTAVKLL